MNNNKKILLWGSLAVILLTGVIVFLFLNLSRGDGKEEFVVAEGDITIYNGVPSDAVAILDFKHLNEYRPLLNDTASFARGILNQSGGLVKFQKRLLADEAFFASPFLYSLHYSAKNSVSFLQVADIKSVPSESIQSLINECDAKKRYNGVNIYTFSDDLYVALAKNLLLASSSTYVLESSIRHLENNTSVLDKKEFEDLLRKNGALSGVYVNHSQIGKLFSGIVTREFLGYSDFFLKFAGWSCFEIKPMEGRLNLAGYLENNNDESCFSNIFYGQSARKSFMGRILPASTVFAVSLPFSSLHEYLKSHLLYLEMQKKSGTFAYKQSIVQGENSLKPREWVDSLAIEELVSAYCKFGEKCEWITLIRTKQQLGLSNVISTVVERAKVEEAQPFKYKGYLASVFGELFGHCNEEYSCKVGQWIVLGPKNVLDEFVNGNAYYFNLDAYLEQTPAAEYMNREASLKLVANVKEAGDSLLRIFKPYTRGCISAQMQNVNFQYLTVDIKNEEAIPKVDVNYYAATLAQLPVPKEREDGSQMVFTVDSTINVPAGPFEVKDVSKKSAAYLEQLPNMKLRYLDANKKGVWTIPFDTPICGSVEQIDLYSNGRLQMLFASEDKLYLLDRVGRFVKGYPAKLSKRVVYGPKLLRNVNGIKYSLFVLNEDNSISWYDVSGKPISGWRDIVAPEFVKELPEFIKLGGVRYWILRAPSQLYLYTLDGKMLNLADKKRKIDRESEITLIEAGVLRVRCTDGKDYAWNLESGKLKKLD